MIRRRVYSLRRTSGFTLIEVMIAVLVLALGLLGFALLQTMSVRFSQSANYRTQATNLAYDLLDQMRANRLDSANYGGTGGASFVGSPGLGDNCSRPTGTVSVGASVARWQCQVVEALGEDSSAVVTHSGGASPVVRIVLTWNDERAGGAANPETTFAVETRL